MQISKDISTGYLYFMDRRHPLANSQGKVYFHRHVMWMKLGRRIRGDEFVHHVDEDKENNDPSNLVIQSRSEHAVTHKGAVTPVFCGKCGKLFVPAGNYGAKFCSVRCTTKASRRFAVAKHILAKLVWEIPTTKIAKLLGVSDVAVAKRCKLFGISKPPRGSWTQKQE
jgi:hypothetical protein